MPWPDPSDYQEAVQNPRFSFSDHALRGGQPVLNNLGLPKVASGNFACVFEIQNGAQNFAVRCFIREVTDQHRRYKMLAQHLANFRLPSLVGFEYLANGIQLHGQWFPVVKMEWVEGKTLDNFIQAHINNPNVLRFLAARWRGLVTALRGAHMAHGDLQHGNVLVDKSGQMRLVDYDAMFIPPFFLERSPELGHPNYQHPQRAESNYDENLDNFASLVIYLSLLAIAAEPRLWNNFHTGDNLILTRADYLNPEQSSCLKQLKRTQDLIVKKLVAYLEDFCSKPLAKILGLEIVLQNIQVAPLPGRQPTTKTSISKVAPSPQQKATTPSKAPQAKVKCPKCGYLNEPDEIYCQNLNKNCLAVLQGYKQCSSCHKNIVPENALFCPECGVKQ